MFYRARKNLSKNRVHLDLTNETFTLYQKAKDLVRQKKFVQVVQDVYVDVNCRLKVKFENNKESFFSSVSELLDLNDQENNPDVLGYGSEGTNVGRNL